MVSLCYNRQTMGLTPIKGFYMTVKNNAKSTQKQGEDSPKGNLSEVTEKDVEQGLVDAPRDEKTQKSELELREGYGFGRDVTLDELSKDKKAKAE